MEKLTDRISSMPDEDSDCIHEQEHGKKHDDPTRRELVELSLRRPVSQTADYPPTIVQAPKTIKPASSPDAARVIFPVPLTS